jgi:lipoprotein-anchoring transpeptidase ErfK/SrfK
MPRSARLIATLALVVAVAVACTSGAGDGTVSSDGDPNATQVEILPQGLTDTGVNQVGPGSQAADLAQGDDTPRDPKGRAFLHHGDTGPDVMALQRRLVELSLPSGRPDGVFGDATLEAVLTFQRSQGQTADGVVGTTTWALLDAPARPVTPSTTTAPRPKGVDGAAPEGDAAAVPAGQSPPGDPARKTGAWAKAVVTLSAQTMSAYDASGKVVFTAAVSSGKNGLTPVGSFHVQSKSPKAFAGGGSNVYMLWMTRFNGGIGFHSIPKKGDADLPTPLGVRPVSHGCIRMADENAKAVFDNLPIGASVVVQS